LLAAVVGFLEIHGSVLATVGKPAVFHDRYGPFSESGRAR
jgi:hypothetical protein